MLKTFLQSFFTLCIFIFLISCKKSEITFTSNQTPILISEIQVGSGVFLYPFRDIEIEVYYYIPSNYNNESKIIFAMHGGGRDAEGMRNSMISSANQSNHIIIAPKIDAINFSLGDQYILGNVYEDGDNPSDETLNNENDWTFSVIELIFDSLISSLSLTNENYNIIGFSAGGQFVQRFILFKPEARFSKAVVAAPGWYTVIDTNINFPYGFANCILDFNNIENLFSKEVYYIVGELDNNPNAYGLRRNDYADAQGINRLDRAIHFYNVSENIASENNYDFNWNLDIIPNTNHSWQPSLQFALNLINN